MIRTFVSKACALAAAGMVVGAPLAFADDQGVTVSGVLFDDQNRNGVRDAGEPGLAGLRVQGGETVTTDADGRYTLTGVQPNSTLSVWLPTAAEGGKLTLSKPAGDPGQGWVSGWIDIPVGSGPETTYDIGYGKWGADQAVTLKANKDTKKLHPGQTVRLTASLITGKAPGYGGVLITVPKGMHFVHEYLDPGTAYDWLDKQHLRMFGLRGQLPQGNWGLRADVVVDQPVTGLITAVVTHDQGTDTVKGNNFASLDVAATGARQVVAPVHTSKPQADTAPPLAYTGVEPKPYVAAGVALLGVGSALVGVARRKPRRTEVSKS